MDTLSKHSQPRLKRVLTFWDLLIYGMIIMQVVAPIPIFGLLQQRSNDHEVLTVLVAVIPMTFTAISYGRMASLYPMAGSAYTYVGRSISPHLGFLIGWSMLLDYLMIPLISAVIPALAIQRLLPQVPLPVLTFTILLLMTGLNLLGTRATARANTLLLIVSSLAVCGFLFLTVQYVTHNSGWSAVVSLKPLYDPSTFRAGAILSGISLAALTYIGFDGLTTLAEDSVNPKRDMVLAPVLVVLIIGLLSAIELYFLHVVLPDWHSSNLDTSYLDVMQTVGGPWLFTTFLVIMSLSQFGAGYGVQVNAARLLYGMGRDRVLPPSVFGYLSPNSRNPSLNILIIGGLAFVGSVLIPFDQALDLLNFGAFLGYMGVNAAALWSLSKRPADSRRRNVAWDVLVPCAGFVGCFIFWLGLPRRAQVVGSLWLLTGLVYSACKTRWFREQPPQFKFD